MTDDEQIERNKLAAERGWIIQPRPRHPNHWPRTTSTSGAGCAVRDRRGTDVPRRVLTVREQVAMPPGTGTPPSTPIPTWRSRCAFTAWFTPLEGRLSGALRLQRYATGARDARRISIGMGRRSRPRSRRKADWRRRTPLWLLQWPDEYR